MKRNPAHSEVMSGATFKPASSESAARAAARMHTINGHRVKVERKGAKWGCWVWPKENPTQKEVSFTTDKRGSPVAYKFTRGALYPRNIRIGYDAAKLLVSTGQAKEIPYRPMRRTWMATNPKKRNPEAAAVEMRESFTGLPSDKTVVVTEKIHVHEHLAALGELVQLKVKTLKGVVYAIDFGKAENPKKHIGKRVAGWVDRRAKAVTGIGKSFAQTWLNPKRINPNGAPILAVTEDGKNLQIIGGSQALDLKALGMGEFSDKESVIVGGIKTIDYFATKDWQDGKKPETAIYTHRMNEETGGPLPMLRYDTRNKRCFIDGGLYHIKRPLFGGTSPGLEN